MEQREDAKSIGQRPAGSTAALAALVERYQQPLGAYVFHLVGDLDLALAITRETFLGWRGVAATSTAVEDGLRLALYRVATGLALSRGGQAETTRVTLSRSGYTHGIGLKPGLIGDPETGGRVVRPAPPSEVAGSSSAVELSFVRERGLAEAALRHLAPAERAVLLLCDLEQFPIGDVAVILGVSGEAVRRRLAGARGRFRLAYVEVCGARD